MRLIGAPTLIEFAEKHPDSASDLKAWRVEVTSASWKTPHDVKRRYPKASILGNRTVVFNIRQNRYRLHVTIDYPTQSVVVRRIGTHQEYDRWTFD